MTQEFDVVCLGGGVAGEAAAADFGEDLFHPAANAGVECAEYPPARVKQAVCGYGRAEKPQVQQMVKVLLKLAQLPPSDAADALAVALCHATMRSTLALLARALA